MQRLEARRLALYRFQHHLFQKYLYNSLDEVERAYLHEDVGTVLEALYGEQTDEVAVQLARHFLEAGVKDKAAHYLGRAGELAAERYANEEAVTHLGRALAMDPEMEPEERYRLLLAREEVYDRLGQRDAQRSDLDALEALVEGLEARHQAEAANRRARYAIYTGDYAAAIAAAQVVVDRAQACEYTALQAEGHLQWRAALAYQNDHTSAQDQGNKGLALARAAGLRHMEAKALYGLSAVCHIRGDFSEEGDYLERALHLYREIGDRRGEVVTLSNLGYWCCEQGDHSRARTYFEDVLPLSQELGDRRVQVYALGGLGGFHYSVGAYRRARGWFEQALRLAREVQDHHVEGSMTGELGEVRLCEGSFAPARDCFDRALGIAREFNHIENEAFALDGHGWLHRVLAEPRKAADYYDQSLRLFREMDAPQYAMRSLAGLADAALDQGDLAQAQAHVSEILAHLDEGGTLSVYSMPLRIYLSCYRALQAADDPRASDLLEKANGMLMEQADRIGDEAMRRSFLENVAWNREIVELARELGRCGGETAPA